MASKEPYIYFGDWRSLFRIGLSALVDGGGKQDLPLELEYIHSQKNYLPKCGLMPLYMDEKLYLIGSNYSTDDHYDGVSYNPDSQTVMVQVDLDVSWNVVHDPLRHVPRPFSAPPFLGADEILVEKCGDKLFFFHSRDAVDVIGHDTEVLDLRTGKKHSIDNPPSLRKQRIGAVCVWGNHISIMARAGRLSLDTEKEEWLDQDGARDMSYNSAASKGKYPWPRLYTDHAVAHLGRNLYITFATNSNPLREQEDKLQLILYQFSSDDLTQISQCRVLDELDFLFDHSDLCDHLQYLGDNVVCMLSIFRGVNLQVATFKVDAVQDKACLLGLSILKEAIPRIMPCFIFTIEHSHSAKRYKVV